MSKNFRDLSRTQYSATDPINSTDINVGSFQRIADACELMAKTHIQLISERDQYKRWYTEEKTNHEATQRSNSGLRGEITKLKARIEVLEDSARRSTANAEDTRRMAWLEHAFLGGPTEVGEMIGLPGKWHSLRDAVDRAMDEGR